MGTRQRLQPGCRWVLPDRMNASGAVACLAGWDLSPMHVAKHGVRSDWVGRLIGTGGSVSPGRSMPAGKTVLRSPVFAP